MLDFGVSPNTLSSARFLVGAVGGINVAHVTFQCSAANAITLIDSIVFRNDDAARRLDIWAHELHHVRQFAEWGSDSFAVQYCNSAKHVEDEAYAVQARFNSWYQAQQKPG